MIAKIIQWCVGNRGMVLLLTACVLAAGMWSASHITIDAIPDLSDVQVIIRTEYPGQAPQIVEDQVTYPLTTAMLAVPYAKVVRGYSMFGSSFVYIIFEDGTDLYWARSRVLEQLNFVSSQLPKSVSPQLGPDATAVGWVYQYILTTGPYCADHPQGLWHDPQTDAWYEDKADAPNDKDVQQRLVHQRVFPKPRVIYADRQENKRYDSLDTAPADVRDRLEPIELTRGYDSCPLNGKPLTRPGQDLSDLRGLQDWYLRFELTAVEGVSEVAPVGGFVKQYQVVVDPVKLLAYNLPLKKIKMAIRQSNVDVGGRLIEMSETEYMVRGLGYLGGMTEQEIAEARASGQTIENVRTDKVLAELRKVSLGANEQGTPIYLADVAEVRVGPEIRRGIAEWNGLGEVVGGTIVMRFAQNARATIERAKDKLFELEKGLPPGVAIEVAYDRSDLIERAVDTVRKTLTEEIIVVSLVILVFLLHARSAMVAALVLPIGVMATLSIMYLFDINANIMSLGGIAISIGIMVDSSIVMVENAHKHLEHEKHRVAKGGEPRPQAQIIGEAAAEVGPTLFFSLLIITVSFLPIFVLGEQSGRMFKPLAFTKTFAMGSAAILAITIIPVMMVYLISERVLPKAWSRKERIAMIALVMLLPAITILFWPLRIGAIPILLILALMAKFTRNRGALAIGYVLGFLNIAAMLLAPLIPGDFIAAHRWTLVVCWGIFIGLVLLPQRIQSEERNPISLILQKLYNPAFTFVMQYQWSTLIAAFLLILVTLWPLSRLGSEFMPPLEEGDLLYMPTTDPGISMTKARELLQQTDKLIMQFPEVQTVFGKAGRSETATDPAPPSMFETTITLRRDKSLWRTRPVGRFYSDWPDWLAWMPGKIWSDQQTITINDLVYGYDWADGTHVPGMNEIMQIPGLTNAWTMPIKTRIDMLSTGIKTPIGIKVLGPDLRTLSDLAAQIANVVKTAEGTGPYTVSAFPEKSVGGNYFDININRDEIARYGLSIADVQDVVMSAMGGMNITSTVEGLERYPVNLRYPHELRDNIESLRQTLVATPSGAQVPIGQLAQIQIHKGPPMIKSENARLTSWVYVDIAGLDVGTYVANAQQAVAGAVELPAGYSIIWSGQYEYMQAARKRLAVVVPLAGVLILLLLYMATKSWLRVLILVASLPFSLVGAVWLLYLLDYNLSLAVGVGIIALAGLAVETGLVMLLYLENSFDRFEAEGRMRNTDDLWHAIQEGAVQRIRPKTMTVMTTFIGLVPLLWASGAGADTMRRLAAPMIGGLATAFLLELLLYPVLFYIAKRFALMKQFKGLQSTPVEDAA